MLQLVNQARAQQGLAALCEVSQLMASTLLQSQYQASINTMTHDGPIGLMARFTNQGFGATAVAENVAVTPDTNVQDVFTAWMNSPEHQANIMGNYAYFGSGVVQGSGGQYYWTQHFASGTTTQTCISGSAPTGPISSAPAGQTPTPVPTQSPGNGQTPSAPGQTPYGPSQTPYGPSQTPYGPSQTPYGSGPTPSAPGQTPYGSGQTPYGSGQTPYTSGQTPYGPGQNQPKPRHPHHKPSKSGGQPQQQNQPTKPFNISEFSVPPGSPRFICIRNLCYRIVSNVQGQEGFLPDLSHPAGNSGDGPAFS